MPSLSLNTGPVTCFFDWLLNSIMSPANFRMGSSASKTSFFGRPSSALKVNSCPIITMFPDNIKFAGISAFNSGNVFAKINKEKGLYIIIWSCDCFRKIYMISSLIHAFLFIRMVFFRLNMDILNFWANIILIYS